MTDAEDCRRGEDVEEAEVRSRSAFLAQVHGLDRQKARALVWRELGYTHGPIARKVGVTEGTVAKWMDQIAEKYGIEAVYTKTADERTGRLL